MPPSLTSPTSHASLTCYSLSTPAWGFFLCLALFTFIIVFSLFTLFGPLIGLPHIHWSLHFYTSVSVSSFTNMDVFWESTHAILCSSHTYHTYPAVPSLSFPPPSIPSPFITYLLLSSFPSLPLLHLFPHICHPLCFPFAWTRYPITPAIQLEPQEFKQPTDTFFLLSLLPYKSYFGIRYSIYIVILSQVQCTPPPPPPTPLGTHSV